MDPMPEASSSTAPPPVVHQATFVFDSGLSRERYTDLIEHNGIVHKIVQRLMQKSGDNEQSLRLGLIITAQEAPYHNPRALHSVIPAHRQDFRRPSAFLTSLPALVRHFAPQSALAPAKSGSILSDIWDIEDGAGLSISASEPGLSDRFLSGLVGGLELLDHHSLPSSVPPPNALQQMTPESGQHMLSMYYAPQRSPPQQEPRMQYLIVFTDKASLAAIDADTRGLNSWAREDTSAAYDDIDWDNIGERCRDKDIACSCVIMGSQESSRATAPLGRDGNTAEKLRKMCQASMVSDQPDDVWFSVPEGSDVFLTGMPAKSKTSPPPPVPAPAEVKPTPTLPTAVTQPPATGPSEAQIRYQQQQRQAMSLKLSQSATGGQPGGPHILAQLIANGHLDPAIMTQLAGSIRSTDLNVRKNAMMQLSALVQQAQNKAVSKLGGASTGPNANANSNVASANTSANGTGNASASTGLSSNAPAVAGSAASDSAAPSANATTTTTGLGPNVNIPNMTNPSGMNQQQQFQQAMVRQRALQAQAQLNLQQQQQQQQLAQLQAQQSNQQSITGTNQTSQNQNAGTNANQNQNSAPNQQNPQQQAQAALLLQRQQQLAAAAQAAQAQQQQQQPTPSTNGMQRPAIWQGNLCWQIKAERTVLPVVCSLLSSTTSPSDLQLNSWPQNLEMTNMMPMNMPDLQVFVKNSGSPCVLFQLAPQAAADAKARIQYLAAMLEARNLAAFVKFGNPGCGILLVSANKGAPRPSDNTRLLGVVCVKQPFPGLNQPTASNPTTAPTGMSGLPVSVNGGPVNGATQFQNVPNISPQFLQQAQLQTQLQNQLAARGSPAGGHTRTPSGAGANLGTPNPNNANQNPSNQPAQQAQAQAQRPPSTLQQFANQPNMQTIQQLQMRQLAATTPRPQGPTPANPGQMVLTDQQKQGIIKILRDANVPVDDSFDPNSIPRENLINIINHAKQKAAAAAAAGGRPPPPQAQPQQAQQQTQQPQGQGLGVGGTGVGLNPGLNANANLSAGYMNNLVNNLNFQNLGNNTNNANQATQGNNTNLNLGNLGGAGNLNLGNMAGSGGINLAQLAMSQMRASGGQLNPATLAQLGQLPGFNLQQLQAAQAAAQAQAQGNTQNQSQNQNQQSALGLFAAQGLNPALLGQFQQQQQQQH